MLNRDHLVWPIHPQPLRDELMSSWMIRLAHSNGCKVHEFYVNYFGKHRQIWTRDVDHYAPTWLVSGLSNHTRLPFQSVYLMTLRAFESLVFSTFNETGFTKFILPLSVFHRTRRLYGQQYCPICLDQDATPYFRKRWRLSLSTVCVEHGVLLHDRCLRCGQPVIPHRLDFNISMWPSERFSMASCAFCRFSLTNITTSAVSWEIELQAEIDDVLNQGFATLNGGTPIYSHLYFEGIRAIVLGLARLKIQKVDRQSFERAPIRYRLMLLREALELLKSWPSRFVEFCYSIKAPYSLFRRDIDILPYWVDSVLRQRISQITAPVSKEEKQAIIKVAEKHKGKSIRSLVRQISGRDPKNFFRPESGVSDEVAAMLFASLDREISFQNGRRRFLLIRDKIMFMAARLMRLSSNQLIAMQTSDVKTQLSGFTSIHHIETSQQLDNLLYWYQTHVRSVFVSSNHSSLFTSLSGSPLHHSAIGSRFKRAVRAAHLDQEIEGWNTWIKGTNAR